MQAPGMLFDMKSREKFVRPFSRTLSHRMTVFCLLVSFLTVGQEQRAAAQMNMCSATMGTQDQAPPNELPAPQKMSGIGNVHMQIKATPEAQMWFDQGLNLIHDFWDYESARAFEQSVRVDPQCAMCYWGLYQAESFFHGTSRGYAVKALAQAVSLKNHASKRERLYIEAAAVYEDGLKARKFQEAHAEQGRLFQKLVKQYPKDTQAQIFLANNIMDGFDEKGEPRAGQKEALALFESVMKADPNNSAANHYYIHALEASAHPERALHSAEILASLAPSSGHMVHMPGHIYYRVGDYARASKAFAASLQVDEQYLSDQHVKADNDWNYVHNLMYSVANLLEEGKLKEATELSAKLSGARGQLDSTLYSFSTRDSVARLDPRLPVALRKADWVQVKELLKASGPRTGLPNLDFLARELAEFAAGMHSVEGPDSSQAEEASTRFDAELWRMTQQVKRSGGGMQGLDVSSGAPAPTASAPKNQLMPDAMLQPVLSMLSVMSLELRGSVLTVERHTDEPKKLFALAIQEEKALGYREPPSYIRPVGEAEGAALMRVGNWAGAKAAYQQALSERPRSGFPLYGIAISSEKAGDSAAAAKEYQEFLAVWRDADPELAQVAHAQTYLAEHPAVAVGTDPKSKGLPPQPRSPSDLKPVMSGR
jgi:tetratricopeptide (TPR) repeat protein